MSARDEILGSIRRSLRRDVLDPTIQSALDQRLTARGRHVQLARIDRDHDGLVQLFEEMALALSATVGHVASTGDVPAAVADYLTSQNLPATVKAAPGLKSIPWETRPTLEISYGPAVDSDAVSVTPCVAAVAETGTLVLHSGPDTPSTLNFLPDTHIVVVRRSQVTGSYENALDAIRDRGGQGREGLLPRTINMISGPSRTGDIEQTIQLGAHGPRRLHILLLDGE
ncbi:lactate utilization protein C [Lacibacterium aquatile]|uniref:Lactate utilization protein C n=1 Tax=Lacibacterium aquatile TaxID=1168082 RepID=A0ABW5DQZ0_9PROT